MPNRAIDWSQASKRIKALSPGDFINLCSIGYTLQRAWVFLLFLNVGTSTLTATGEPIPNEVYLISSISLCVTLFAAALKPQAFTKFATHAVRRWIGPLCTTLGSALLLVLFAFDLPPLLIEIAAGVLTGFGSGVIDLGYGEIYRNRSPEKTGLEVPFATLLAAAIYALGVVAPPIVGKICVLVLPLASSYILLVEKKIWKPGYERSAQPVAVNIKRFTWRIGLCACVVGMADGFARQVFAYINNTTVGSLYEPGMLISCLVMFVVLFSYRMLAESPNYLSMYRLVTFTMAFFFMLMPVFTTTGLLENTVALVSYNSFNVLIWLLLAELSYTYRLSSLVVFGIGWGMVTFGIAMGQVGATAVIQSVGIFTPQQVSLVVLVVTIIALGSYMFILPEDEMIDITSIDEKKASKKEKTGDPRTGITPSSDRKEGSDFHPRPFRDRCSLVAAQYRLTPRETEIMTLFAKGRSNVRIQEELVLSRGTVTTHLQHVYQKVGVHSKQELLDIIEGAKH